MELDREMDIETEGDKVDTLSAQRPPESTIHTEPSLREFTVSMFNLCFLLIKYIAVNNLICVIVFLSFSTLL